MNDPNGLIFHEGVYHLYYQHHPLTPYFGQISWGHATSADLKTWNHQPIALHAYDEVSMYSGCVIFDADNVLNQPSSALVAIYTEHEGDETNYQERICLAISPDGGKTFDQANRHIIIERKDPDFRDPKVFFHEPSKKWIMVVALPKEYTICIYSSTDLTQWTHESDFTAKAPQTQYWECPDLYPLSDEYGVEHWVMSISGENYVDKPLLCRQASWGMFYFIGAFDGTQFTQSGNHSYLDFGRDFYAGITFEGTGSEKIMIAWCNNWLTANQPHARNWSGIMSSPRKLQLRDGYLVHELITDIEPVTVNIATQTNVYLPKNECQISFKGNAMEISKAGKVIDRRAFPLIMEDIRIYEDYGIIECLINEGESATWLLL